MTYYITDKLQSNRGGEQRKLDHRPSVLFALIGLISCSLAGQTPPPSKEYIRLGSKNVVLAAVASLQANASDPTGYSLSAQGLLYPSALVDVADRPATDLLEMILSLADANGMKVYLGSIQTSADWTTGAEFNALRKYNLLVAQEIVANYGHHPSLQGWYFTQEIWMNWVMYYQPNYYGTTLLANFVADMKTVDPTKPVAAAVVFKEFGVGSMPGMAPSDVQTRPLVFCRRPACKS